MTLAVMLHESEYPRNGTRRIKSKSVHRERGERRENYHLDHALTSAGFLQFLPWQHVAHVPPEIVKGIKDNLLTFLPHLTIRHEGKIDYVLGNTLVFRLCRKLRNGSRLGKVKSRGGRERKCTAENFVLRSRTKISGEFVDVIRTKQAKHLATKCCGMMR